MKKLIEKIKALFVKVKVAIKWPKWYFAGAIVVLFLIAIEVLGTWAGFAWPFIGFGIWAYKKTVK